MYQLKRKYPINIKGQHHSLFKRGRASEKDSQCLKTWLQVIRKQWERTNNWENDEEAEKVSRNARQIK